MAVALYELATSRQSSFGGPTATATLRYLALRSDDAAEVEVAAATTAPAVYSGLFRLDVTCTPQGGGVWDIAANYGIPGDGGNLADLPPQGDPDAPAPDQPDPDTTAPLGPEYSFTTAGGTRRLYQSLAQRDFVGPTGEAVPDHEGAINVTKDGVDGVDVVAPNLEWSITRKFASVTLEYQRELADLTGSTNIDTFYGYERGELLFLGADGTYKPGDGFSITFRFAAKRNTANLVVAPGFDPLAEVRGWEYLWVQFKDAESAGQLVKVPAFAYLERVYPERSFKRLKI